MRRQVRAAAAARRATLLVVVALTVASCSSSPHRGATTSVPTSAPATTAPPGTTTPGSPTTAAAGSSGPCGFLQPAQAHYSHVLWIWMENHSYGAVIGSPSAPFENQVAAQCGLATNYHNVTHPSLPNYIAATSGLGLGQLGPFYPDCDPSPSCSAGPGVQSIFSQAPSWKGYAESMNSPCAKGSSGDYAARHNPAVYYQSLAAACAANDVPIANLYRDLSAGSLPAFSFVTPNLIHDTHDGSVSDGDRWLRTVLGDITSAPQYRAGTVAVFIVWDEGEGGGTSNCAANTTDVGCHVPALVLSASTRSGTASAGLFSHYSLLRTAEDLLGLPALGQAAAAASMAPAFGLTG